MAKHYKTRVMNEDQESLIPEEIAEDLAKIEDEQLEKEEHE